MTTKPTRSNHFDIRFTDAELDALRTEARRRRTEVTSLVAEIVSTWLVQQRTLQGNR